MEYSSKLERRPKHRKELAAAGKATSGEGVKATRLASRVALTPSPLVAFPAAANSFLCLGRRSSLDEYSIPENG